MEFIVLDISLNKDLLDLTAGKRVALIGPAPHLVGKNLGKILDSYDIICRVNSVVPPIDIQNDYGNRTDILFHNCATDYMPSLIEKIAKNQAEFEALKMVCCLATKASNRDINYLSWDDDHVSDVVRNFAKVNKHDVPFYWIGVRDYRELYHYMDLSEPYTGNATIAVLSQYPIKELLITGFSFYLGGNTYQDIYYSGHWPASLISSRKNKNFKNGFHGERANTKQVRIIKKILNQSDNIIIDSYMNNILKLNHPRELKI